MYLLLSDKSKVEKGDWIGCIYRRQEGSWKVIDIRKWLG